MSTMTRPGLLGVLYAEDFDDLPQTSAPAAAEPEPELIEPVFTLAELEAAKAEAGRIARAEAERGLIGSRTQMITLLANGVADARAEALYAAEEASEGVAKCLLSALSACLPALCARHGAAELQALARIVLPALRDEPRIVVRVHPHMLPVMRDEVAAMDMDFADCIHLLPSDAVAPGDARISWAAGSAVRDAGRARAAVHDALAALGLLDHEDLPKEAAHA